MVESVDVSSRLGEGTTFSVILPAAGWRRRTGEAVTQPDRAAAR